MIDSSPYSSVSVIIPNYNHASFLVERIESVLNQSYNYFELIIIDDCSPDNSREIIEKFRNHDKVSKIIYNDINSGSPFKQWAKGIREAKGKYIWIAESDDAAALSFLEESVNFMESNPEFGLVYFDSKYVSETGECVGFGSEEKNNYFNTKRWSNDFEGGGYEEVINYLFAKTAIDNASAILYRSDLLKNENYLNELETYKNAGDLFSIIYTCFNSKIKYISKPLNLYREHRNNITKTGMQNGNVYYERIKCFSWAIDYIMTAIPNNHYRSEIKAASKKILRKNFTWLIDFNYTSVLKKIIAKLKAYHILNYFEYFYLMMIVWLYNIRLTKAKSLAKKLVFRYCDT